MERRTALDGSLPQRIDRRPPTARAARRPVRSPSSHAGSGSQAVSTTMAFTRLLRNLARDEDFGPRVVPIIPDEARTFGMDALFREFKIYAAAGPEVRAGRRTTCCCPTPRRRTARSSRRASPRPARWPASPPPAPSYATPRRADGAVLHLLFDVRLPAGRRPHLGGGRRPGPRLPARRHRRAHHAARRGPAAPGRPQPRAGLDGADRARPTTRRSPTRWPPSCGPASPACTAAARRRRPTSSTTSPSTTRTTRCRPPPDRASPTSDIVEGLYRWAPAPEGLDPRATILFSGSAQARRPRGRRRSWPSTTTSAPSCGRPPRTRRCARTRSPSSAGTGSTPTEPPRVAARHRAPAPTSRARSSPSPTS